MKLLLPLILASSLLLSCTENQRVKAFGGNMDVAVAPGHKFVTATWKTSKEGDSSLWYTTRPMREGESPETWKMQEQSNYGILEGSVTFKESK
jgi:hypothetical protein